MLISHCPDTRDTSLYLLGVLRRVDLFLPTKINYTLGLVSLGSAMQGRRCFSTTCSKPLHLYMGSKTTMPTWASIPSLSPKVLSQKSASQRQIYFSATPLCQRKVSITNMNLALIHQGFFLFTVAFSTAMFYDVIRDIQF